MSAKEFVAGVFEKWEKGDNAAAFFGALAADVIWTARGTTPISGTVHGKDAYMEKVYQPLKSVFNGPTSCHVRQVFGEGNMVAVEWHGATPNTTDVVYAQDYCWLIRVSEDGTKIAEVRGYFDTALVDALMAAVYR